MARPSRHLPIRTNVNAIRLFGRGEGFMPGEGRKAHSPAYLMDRSFRRRLKGIVGNGS